MSNYIILYRIKDEYDGCRYIELNSDGTIHVDYSGEPIVSNARCSTRIDEKLGEAIIGDGYYYELYDGRVVQYNC